MTSTKRKGLLFLVLLCCICCLWQAATDVWENSGRYLAPNGGVMRTSVLGIQDFSDIKTVITNTEKACRVTHADPRCIASCVAVTTAIALMLQGKHRNQDGGFDDMALTKAAYGHACDCLETADEVKMANSIDDKYQRIFQSICIHYNNKSFKFYCSHTDYWLLQ